MTKDTIKILKIICDNTNRTKDSDNLYNIFVYKNKKFSKDDWKEVLEELTNASLISISNNMLQPKPQAFKEVEVYKETQNTGKISSFVRKLFAA